MQYLSADPNASGSAFVTEGLNTLTNLSQLNTTYQQGGLMAVVQPAIPYVIGYAVGIAVLSAVLTTMMMKKRG